MAAFLAAAALGVIARENVSDAMEAFHAFDGLPHRLEWVAEYNDVLYINDSKATNDEAAAVALKAMTRPTRLLLGGRDKGGGYAQVAAHGSRIERVYAFGEAQGPIGEALGESFDVSRSKDLETAFREAHGQAQPGDVVLLAPACSSFDAFPNFMVRGDAFKSLVAGLEAA